MTFISPLALSFALEGPGKRINAIPDGRGERYTAEGVPGNVLASYFADSYTRLSNTFRVKSLKRNQIDSDLIVSKWEIEGMYLSVDGTTRMRVRSQVTADSGKSKLEAVQIEEIWNCTRINSDGIDFLSLGFLKEMIQFCFSKRAPDLASVDPRSFLSCYSLAAWELFKDQPYFGTDLVRGEADLIFEQAAYALGALFISIAYFMLRVIQLSFLS